MELVVLVNNSGTTTMNASEISNAIWDNGTFVCLYDDGIMYYPNRGNIGSFEFVNLSDPSDIVYVTSGGSISYDEPVID